MAQQTPYDQPGSGYDQDGQDPDVGYGGYGAAGDPFDPRGDYDPLAGLTRVGDHPQDDEEKNGGRRDPEDEDDPDSKKKDGDHQDSEDDKHNLRKVRNDEVNPDGPKKDKDKEGDDADEVSTSDLKDAEKEGNLYSDASGNLYIDDGKDSKGSSRGKTRQFIKKHKKKAGIAGLLGISVLGGGVGLFVALLPLKTEHIVDNVENHFFDNTKAALTEETRHMVENYFISRVMPGYKSCGSTIKAGCSALEFGSSPVDNVFNTWSKNRMENKLAEKGIVLEHRTLSDTWYLKTPDGPPGGKNIGKDGKSISRVLDDSGATRETFDQSVKDTTKWYQVYFRYKAGVYAEKVQGVKRCVVFCGIRDPIKESISDKKKAAQLFLNDRVIMPRSQTLAIAMECLITDCVATDNQPSGSDGENGEPKSVYNTDVVNAVSKYRQDLDAHTLNEIVDAYNQVTEKGFQNYLITKALTPVIGEAAAGRVTGAIPIAGWVNLAAQIVNAGNDTSDNLKKLRYVTNSVAAIELFMMYRSYADEVHTGHADATEVGSFGTSLAPGNHGQPTDPEVGGTAGAEQVPLYSSVVEGKQGNSAQTASLGNLLSGTASADSLSSTLSSTASNYLCGNGNPLVAPAPICPEEFLGGGVSIANGIHDFLNLPGLNVITLMAQGWQATVGQVFKFGGDITGDAFSEAMKPVNAACDVPVLGDIVTIGYCPAKALAEKELPKIVEGVVTALIQNPFSSNMSGGRIFDLMASGADALANQTAHVVLGAQSLTPLQSAQISNQQEQEERQAFSHQSFFARMFSTDSQYSLVSKLAMDVPLGGAQAIAQGSLVSMLNPFGALSHGFGSIFSGKASADAQAQPDPFGVTQYGYPENTIPTDPETYWKQNCSDNEANAYQKDNSWNEAASGTKNADPNTGEPLNKTTNGCLLIKAAAGAAGGLFDSSNLTQDDLSDVNAASGSSGASTPATPAGQLPTGTAQDLAGQLLPYVKSNKIQCVFSPGCPDITNTASNKSIKGGEGCLVDSLQPGLLGLMLGLVKMGHTFILSALCSDHSTDDITEHAGGRAADFNTIDGVFIGPSDKDPWTSQKINAAGKLDQDAATLIPDKNDLIFGQVECHKLFDFQKVPPDFPDGCSHQHIEVETK